MSPEPITAYGMTIQPEPLLPQYRVKTGRWGLKVLGSVDDPTQRAYIFVVDCEPCNADGSTPCEDKRSRQLVRQSVTRLSFQTFSLPKDPKIFDTILRQVERRLEDSPECCIRHMLLGFWDRQPCITGESQSAGRMEEAAAG